MITVALPVGDTWGWGLCGLNLTRIFTAMGVEFELISNQAVKPLDRTTPVLNCLSGPSFIPFFPVRGTRNVAYGFIEDMKLAKQCIDFARRWDHIVCGSTWMKNALIGLGLTKVSTAIQGVDPNIFNEDQRCHGPEEFKIFIGGKLEYRKGQDVAIAAAKVLMKKHGDVKLIVALNNPWPDSLATIRKSTLIAVPDLSGKMSDVVSRLMRSNGIDEWEYVECSNTEMARVYGECNVGLFLSRCEAGNNMVLSEAMATGLPCIVNYATGQKDATDLDAAICVTDGLEGEGGWVDPNLDSVVFSLEWAYNNREQAMKIGAKGSRYARQLTWTKTATALLEAVNG